MDNASLGLGELGFWLAIAIGFAACVWSDIKKKQMKHEMTLKLLEKGQAVDQELLEKLLVSDKAVQQKSVAEQRREAGGMGGFAFMVVGLVFAFVGILGTGSELVPGPQGPAGVPIMVFEDQGPSWLLIGLGAFSFAFGLFCWFASDREYKRTIAEEKLPRD